jgi:hypothetical protein
LYDPVRTEQTIAGMKVQGYNVVRIFLDILQKGDIVNESGTGLSPKYIANLADFLMRAKPHNTAAQTSVCVVPSASERQ